MEQKAPRLSSGSLVAGGLCMAFAAANAFGDLAFKPGFSVEEIVSVIVGGVCFVVSFLASRPRAVPELPHRPSIEEQYEAFDAAPTPYRSTEHTQFAPVVQPQPAAAVPDLTDSFNAIQQPVPQTVVSSSPAPSSNEVAAALASLSTGEFGARAAEQAAASPAPHVATEQGRQFTQAVGSLASSHVRAAIVDVPLPPNAASTAAVPLAEVHPELPSMLDLDALLEEVQAPQDTPSLPHLDSVATAALPSAPPVVTPELPDLDGLF